MASSTATMARKPLSSAGTSGSCMSRSAVMGHPPFCCPSANAASASVPATWLHPARATAQMNRTLPLADRLLIRHCPCGNAPRHQPDRNARPVHMPKLRPRNDRCSTDSCPESERKRSIFSTTNLRPARQESTLQLGSWQKLAAVARSALLQPVHFQRDQLQLCCLVRARCHALWLPS